jgi:hypothetical protein
MEPAEVSSDEEVWEDVEPAVTASDEIHISIPLPQPSQ